MFRKSEIEKFSIHLCRSDGITYLLLSVVSHPIFKLILSCTMLKQIIRFSQQSDELTFTSQLVHKWMCWAPSKYWQIPAYPRYSVVPLAASPTVRKPFGGIEIPWFNALQVYSNSRVILRYATTVGVYSFIYETPDSFWLWEGRVCIYWSI